MPYNYQKITATSWTNTSKYFAVLVGVDGENAFAVAGDNILVSDKGNMVVDSFELESFGVAASETLVGIPRRMLIPPQGTITTTEASTIGQVIISAFEDTVKDENKSLAMALAIL